jgi:hypothetical protein
MHARALVATLASISFASTAVCDLALGQQCPAGSSAGTFTVSSQFGPQYPPWSLQSIPVPQFEPIAGQVLLRADVHVTGILHGSNQMENTGTTGGVNVTWTVGSNMTVATPVPGHGQLDLNPSISGQDSLAVYDGTLDFAGRSGVSNMNLHAQDRVSFSITDPGVLASVFSGSGTIPFDTTAIDAATMQGFCNGETIFVNQSTIVVSVTYTFCSPGVDFCVPGLGNVMACPCGNPQQPAGSARGCNNSASTGGARLQSGGAASLVADSVVFTSSGEKPMATTVFLQGTSSIASGAVFGQGVRCNGGTMKRLFVKSASGGVATAPDAGDPSVSARSAALGDTIAPGSHRYYSAYYRDATVLGGCPSASTFNASQGQDVIWAP